MHLHESPSAAAGSPVLAVLKLHMLTNSSSRPPGPAATHACPAVNKGGSKKPSPLQQVDAHGIEDQDRCQRQPAIEGVWRRLVEQDLQQEKVARKPRKGTRQAGTKAGRQAGRRTLVRGGDVALRAATADLEPPSKRLQGVGRGAALRGRRSHRPVHVRLLPAAGALCLRKHKLAGAA